MSDEYNNIDLNQQQESHDFIMVDAVQNERNDNQYSHGDYNTGNGLGPEPPKKKRFTWLKQVAFVLAIGVITGGVLAILTHLMNEDKETTKISVQTEKEKNDEPKETVQAGQSEGDIKSTKVFEDTSDKTVSTVAEKSMSSIVAISSKATTSYLGQTYNQEGSGSGFVYKKTKTNLLIATNNHVVSGAKSISVTFIDGSAVKATIKGTDELADLAVITVKLSDIKDATLKKVTVASIGNSDEIKVGQMAIAIGNALGYGQSVTVGYISAKDREIQTTDTTMNLLQTDAAINPGNSGGALLNDKGEVVGINSMKYTETTVEGMGYAIPITKAVPILNELLTQEKVSEKEKGYLGISGSNVSESDNTTYGIPVGIYVAEISEDGSAKDSGIEKGDIITKINGIEVKTVEALRTRVNSYKVGTKIKITIQRRNDGKYEEQEVTVKLKGSSTLNGLSGSNSSDSSQSQNGNDSGESSPFGNGEDGGQSGNPFFNYGN